MGILNFKQSKDLMKNFLRWIGELGWTNESESWKSWAKLSVTASQWAMN